MTSSNEDLNVSLLSSDAGSGDIRLKKISRGTTCAVSGEPIISGKFAVQITVNKHKPGTDLIHISLDSIDPLLTKIPIEPLDYTPKSVGEHLIITNSTGTKVEIEQNPPASKCPICNEWMTSKDDGHLFTTLHKQSPDPVLHANCISSFTRCLNERLDEYSGDLVAHTI